MINENSLRKVIRREIRNEIDGDAYQSGRMGMLNITAGKKKKLSKHDSFLQEKIDSKDYSELRDFIRVEIASVMFDLFRKRNVWI